MHRLPYNLSFQPFICLDSFMLRFSFYSLISRIYVFKIVGNKPCYVAIKITDFLWSHHVLWVPQNLAKDKSYLFRLFNIYMLLDKRNMLQFMTQGIFHSNLSILAFMSAQKSIFHFLKPKKIIKCVLYPRHLYYIYLT